MAFFEELKRRNVVRVGIAYVIVAWLLLQVADLVLENIDAPDWIMQVFMLALAIGLPLSLFFAWAFELTPEGLKRERDVDRSESITHVTGRKLDRAINLVLVLALGYFAWDKWLAEPGPGVPPVAAVVESGESAPTEGETVDMAIAVLPFANRSSREEDAFFADGIHDDLLTSLAKVGALKVISRTSVMRYRDTTLSIPEIAAQLGVTKVLEGGIQRSGDHVRINVQLIDAGSDQHLWAENYDRSLSAENLFAIQSEISRMIVNALRATLTDAESERLAAVPTTSLEAYGEFVLGRQALTLRTVESLEAARAHFERALEFDDRYALAWVGLADAMMLLANYGDLSQMESFAPRQAAIDRALAIDPELGEAYTSWGALMDDREEDEAAERYFQRAIELSPGYATAYHWYAVFLDGKDRPEEGLALARKALDLDPMAPILSTMYAGALWDIGMAEQSTQALQEGIRRNPDFPNNYVNLADNLVNMGRLGEAMLWMGRHSRLASGNAFMDLQRCPLFLNLGDEVSADHCLTAAEEAYPQASLGWRVLLYQYQGRLDEAVALAEHWAHRVDTEFSRRALAWNYLSVGAAQKAREAVEAHHPEFWGDDPVALKPTEAFPAAQAAAILLQLGERERADYLFDAALAVLATLDRTKGIAYGDFDVYIHVVRGHKEAAIAALREAVDAGWRDEWWRLRMPQFDSMLEEPEWIALLTEIEADIARQRQWFENHKDDPII